MRVAVFSGILAGVLIVGLSGKVVRLLDRSAPRRADDSVIALLTERGFVVQVPDASDAPAWITARRNNCTVRIADVSPQGWSRSLVAAQAQGDRLAYSFRGLFYDDQPVTRTRVEDYGRKLGHYLGLPVAPVSVRAVVVSPTCPADTIRPDDAIRLTP